MFDREVDLHTRLNPDQVMDALERRSQRRTDGAQPVAALFEADFIRQDNFRLQLLGANRVGSLPSLQGSVTASGEGSRVTVVIAHSEPFSVAWSIGLVLAALTAIGGVRTLADLPARLSIFVAILAMLVLYWYLARRQSETGTLTAELAIRHVLNARTESRELTPRDTGAVDASKVSRSSTE